MSDSQPLTLGYEQRDIGLDVRLLEATEEDARAVLRTIDHNLVIPDIDQMEEDERKASLRGMYKGWNYRELIPLELKHRALDPNRPRISSEQAKEIDVNLRAVHEAMMLFGITESGRNYFPRHIIEISNPTNIPHPLYVAGGRGNLAELMSTESPHVLFPGLWTSQEDQHADAADDVMEMHGIHTAEFVNDKKSFLDADTTPHPGNTPRGLAYTDAQEGNTQNPYRHMVQIAKSMAELARELGFEVEEEVWRATAEVYKFKGMDEAGHKKYLRAVRIAGMNNGDAELRSYMLAGTADELVRRNNTEDPYLSMPGQIGIPRFIRSALRIERAGIFTRVDSLGNVRSAITALEPELQEDLTPLGEQAVEQLGGFVIDLDAFVEKKKNEAAAKSQAA